MYVTKYISAQWLSEHPVLYSKLLLGMVVCMYVCVYTVWQVCVCVCVCVMVGMQYLILWHNNFDLYSEMLSSLTTTTIFKGHRDGNPCFQGCFS